MTEVLIAGGGVGGLEAALALRVLAGDVTSITMLAPQRHFIYRPLAVNEPFDRGSALQVELAAIAADVGFSLVRDALEGVDPDLHRVRTQEGRELHYDELILALGAWPVAAVPNALTFRGSRDAGRLAEALDALPERPAIDIVVPAGPVWPLPAYELALLTAQRFTDRGAEATITLRTAETEPLQDFGEDGSRRVKELLATRGIRLHTEVEGLTGHSADLVVALPILQGPAVPGLPCDRGGFVPVDAYARVIGESHLHAVGDMTDHRVKQGGLATQQADVAAADIAAGLGVPVMLEPYEPVLRAMLFTGSAPLYLRNPPVPEGEATGTPPWWPAHKISGRHLAPFLATHAELMVPAHA